LDASSPVSRDTSMRHPSRVVREVSVDETSNGLDSHGGRGSALPRKSANTNRAGTRWRIHAARFAALPDAADTAPAESICQVARSVDAERWRRVRAVHRNAMKQPADERTATTNSTAMEARRGRVHARAGCGARPP